MPHLLVNLAGLALNLVRPFGTKFSMSRTTVVHDNIDFSAKKEEEEEKKNTHCLQPNGHLQGAQISTASVRSHIGYLACARSAFKTV